MHLCSLSITYACPYHNPTATMGHSIHNNDISKPLTHTTPYTLSAICPIQWKPGFIREENTSPKCQTPSKSVMMTNCSQVETPMRMMSMQMSFPETASDFFGYANRLLQQLSRWLVSDDLGGEYAGCGCYMWSVVVRPLELLPNSLKRLWRRFMVEKWTFDSWATALVDIPAVSMPIARSLKTCDICGIVLCFAAQMLHILERPFIVASLRHTCAIIMLSNQHLDTCEVDGLSWQRSSLTQI